MGIFGGLVVLGALFVALAVAVKVSFWVVAALFPLFWLWMLVDSIIRNPEEYPTESSNEKLLWIVLMVVFQLAAIAYFFMVNRKMKGIAPRPAQSVAAAPPAPPAAPAHTATSAPPVA
jgi:hypothetical protein